MARIGILIFNICSHLSADFYLVGQAVWHEGEDCSGLERLRNSAFQSLCDEYFTHSLVP
jgi:hypothetical protein